MLSTASGQSSRSDERRCRARTRTRAIGPYPATTANATAMETTPASARKPANAARAATAQAASSAYGPTEG